MFRHKKEQNLYFPSASSDLHNYDRLLFTIPFVFSFTTITVGIHAKCSYLIFKLFRTIHNFTFIQFICQMGEDHCRKFNSYT